MGTRLISAGGKTLHGGNKTGVVRQNKMVFNTPYRNSCFM